MIANNKANPTIASGAGEKELTASINVFIWFTIKPYYHLF